MTKRHSNLDLIKEILKLIEEDKLDSALTQFRKLLDFEGKFSDEEIEKIYGFGRLFKNEKIKDYSEHFITEIDKKIKKKEHENLYFIKSEIIFNLGDNKRALLFLNEALTKYSKNSELLNTRAAILQLLNHLEDALKDINKAIELEPNNPNYLHTRAAILHDLDRPEDALKDINKAIELEPNNPNYLHTRATILHDLDRPEDALKDINKVIELEPKEASYLFARAFILQRLDRPEDALKDINNLLEFEREPTLLASIVYLLIGLKKLVKAKKALVKGLMRYREHKDYYELVMAENALKQAELSETIDKKYDDLEKARKDLDEKYRISQEEIESLKKQNEENKIKVIEFLGIFAGIITFVLSGVSIMGNGTHSLFENLILMMALALSLVLFVLLIDFVSTSKFSISDENVRKNITRLKVVIAVIVIIIFAVLLVFANKI